MNNEEAKTLAQHRALLLAASDGIVSAVIKLHRPANPSEEVDLWSAVGECQGCNNGSCTESGADWPCSTINTINEYLHVDFDGIIIDGEVVAERRALGS